MLSTPDAVRHDKFPNSKRMPLSIQASGVDSVKMLVSSLGFGTDPHLHRFVGDLNLALAILVHMLSQNMDKLCFSKPPVLEENHKLATHRNEASHWVCYSQLQ